MKVLAALLLVTMTISAGCANRGGPVPVEGVVTGKHQTTPKENPSENSPKARPRYFLWVKTKDGPAFVEVTEREFEAVTDGDEICINCKSKAP